MQEAADGRGAGWYDSASPKHDHFSNLLAIKLEIEDTFTEMRWAQSAEWITAQVNTNTSSLAF